MTREILSYITTAMIWFSIGVNLTAAAFNFVTANARTAAERAAPAVRSQHVPVYVLPPGEYPACPDCGGPMERVEQET